MRRQLGVRVVAGCLVAVAALSGCAEKHEASTTLPSESSTSGEELPPLGPADFPVPDEARTQDAAGAEAFVRYYFALLNRSLVDLDPQYLRQFGDGCEDCERIAEETEQDARNGYSYRGGDLTIVGEMSSAITGPGQAESAFVADQAALTVLDSSGRPVPTLVFDGKHGLSSGAQTAWDAPSASWRMTVLTLG